MLLCLFRAISASLRPQHSSLPCATFVFHAPCGALVAQTHPISCLHHYIVLGLFGVITTAILAAFPHFCTTSSELLLMPAPATNRYVSNRPLILGLSKILFVALAQTPLAQAAPILLTSLAHAQKEPKGKNQEDAGLWLYLGFAAFLVLLGGAFAGLTIALMGQVTNNHIPHIKHF